jgi:hypothetical protein
MHSTGCGCPKERGLGRGYRGPGDDGCLKAEEAKVGVDQTRVGLEATGENIVIVERDVHSEHVQEHMSSENGFRMSHASLFALAIRRNANFHISLLITSTKCT